MLFSSTNLRKVINSQKQSGFLAYPVLVTLKSRSTNLCYASSQGLAFQGLGSSLLRGRGDLRG